MAGKPIILSALAVRAVTVIDSGGTIVIDLEGAAGEAISIFLPAGASLTLSAELAAALGKAAPDRCRKRNPG